jgi:hypothetical protein
VGALLECGYPKLPGSRVSRNYGAVHIQYLVGFLNAQRLDRGGGVEWLVLPNWTIRAEYLHLQFNSASQNFNFTGTIAGFPLIATSQASLRTDVDIVRVGVNYLFNWGPAPVWR